MECRLCPRRCGANRALAPGLCGALSTPRVARAGLHQWEEPCISGSAGSGAVFFSGCNLSCVYCQNEVLQDGSVGGLVSPERLSDIFLILESCGAHNINLVTPAPHVTAIAKALTLSKARGLSIPVVYNTNGYELPETLRLLDGLVDVYLPDYKYVTPALSERFSGAADYSAVADAALMEMFRQRGHLKLNDEGLAVSGMLVRHLVLPCCGFDSRLVLDRLKELFSTELHLSIMRQYAPTARCIQPPLNRKITDREYDRVLDHALSCGFTHIITQDAASADLSFTPTFT